MSGIFSLLGRNILRLRRSALASASKASRHMICNRLASTTPLLSQQFKYDAPWFDYSEDDNEPPTIKNFINGSFETATRDTGRGYSIKDIPVDDPSTNKILSYVLESNYAYLPKGENALESAVAAAKAAYPSWSNTPVQTRQRLLLDYAHFLHKQEVREEIA